MKTRWIALSLIAFAAAAQADVKVNFVNPEKFTDTRDNWGFNEKDSLKEIEAHLVAQLSKSLPGRDIRVDVTDVDLAGQIEPFGRRVEWMRVMRSVTIPAMDLKYEVREGGKVVAEGQAKLRDMDYQNGFNSYSGGDPLRYEKRMIDRWVQREFSPMVAKAEANR